jgi:PKD repeat protein
MERRNVILVLLLILATAFLVMPVAAGLAVSDDGEKITATGGATSQTLFITEYEIALNDTITINVSALNEYVASGNLTDANVEVTSFTAAYWIRAVANNTLTLTSTGYATYPEEMLTVTFTGTAENPWISYTAGERTIPLTANRTDGKGEATFNFVIQTGGLTVTEGEKITAADGATSPVITIKDSLIAINETITIDVSSLNYLVATYPVTTANVAINDTAIAATWTGEVVYDEISLTSLLTLTSTEGPTAPNETVTMTFTGAGNPWRSYTGGDTLYTLTATRTDGLGVGNFGLLINTTPPPPIDLIIADGAKITATDGATSPVITITGSDIAPNDTITIDVSGLNTYVSSGLLTGANIGINDTAVNATWTGVVAGDSFMTILTLTSTEGPTTPNETVTVTLTGATDSWTANTHGNQTVLLTATRTDGAGAGTFNFVIETSGLIAAEGEKITSADGATSPVITIVNSPIALNDTITIDVSGLNTYVASGNLTEANVLITSNASAATWTGAIEGNNLTLTSTNGTTSVNETVTVTFTGATNSWIANTHGNQTVPLTANRTDGGGARTFNFVIETTPPHGFIVAANFSASWTTDIPPVTSTFTDTSLGNATSWSWDFGDGTWFNTTVAADRNPVHTYTDVGIYTVNLTATNAYGSDTKTQWDYITVLNGAIREANTSITGLTITNCGGPQSVAVDTFVLPAALIPNNSVLEIQPPADSGFKNITLYALNGVGFSQNGNLITGNPTGVHLVTEEIAPSLGFSSEIGTTSSFNYSIDVSSYPCNAILSTKIWEGVIPEYDNKFRWIASNNSAVPVGTAYTASITKTNFPSGARAKVRMSVNSDWNPSIFRDDVFIWRIADDGNSGQILPTTYLYSDPMNNLDYFEADSPLGLSTFGISSLTGSNNPFQIVAFVAAAVISPSNNPAPASGASSGGGGSGAGQTTVASGATPPDQSKTVKIYSNEEGTITQATTLPSTDGLAKISLDLGIVARDSNGKPLESLSITRIPNLPATPPKPTLSFAGMAYEIGPDGATFSPSISLSFTIPQEQGGQDYVIHEYDHATGTWLELPSRYDPQTGTITVQVSHLCCFALFAKSTGTEKAVTPEPTIVVTSKSSISTNIEMYGWIFAMIVQNPVTLVIMLAALAMVAYFGWYKRRL